MQRLLRSAVNPGEDFASDGSQFDQLFDDGDTLMLGELVGRVLATPGHTPGCVTYVFGDAAFTGDTLFIPDCGSGRADFPGGDAGTLYRSIRRILSLPPQTRLFAGHDYAPGGRGYAWESTVSEQRETNIHANDRVTEAEFVALAEPALMRTAVPFNVVGGRLAALEASDLKPPLVIP